MIVKKIDRQKLLTPRCTLLRGITAPEITSFMLVSDTYLIFTLEDENVGNSTKRDSQMYDFRFRNIIRNIPNVDHFGRPHILIFIKFHLKHKKKLNVNIFVF